MSYSLKLKTKFLQALQKIVSAVMLISCITATSQLSADFGFFEEVDSIFTQLEVEKPKVRNNLIDQNRSRKRDSERAKIRFSLDQAASRARSQSGGRVIKAQTSWRNGQPIHTIRVLSDDKRVKTYRYDGVSGRRL